MKPRSASAPASWPKIGMPATVSSRSTGPEPATSTTAGCRSRPSPVGMVSVPAMLKPDAGIVTSTSVGLRAVCRRAADAGEIAADDRQGGGRDLEARESVPAVDGDGRVDVGADVVDARR